MPVRDESYGHDGSVPTMNQHLATENGCPSAAQTPLEVITAQVDETLAKNEQLKARQSLLEARLSAFESRLAEQGAKLADQGAKLADQGAKLAEQGAKLADQGAKLAEQAAEIDTLKRQVKHLNKFVLIKCEQIEEKIRGDVFDKRSLTQPFDLSSSIANRSNFELSMQPSGRGMSALSSV